MKSKKDYSLLPYILGAAAIFLAFGIILFISSQSGLKKKEFWLECAVFMNTDSGLYGVSDDTSTLLTEENVSAFASLLSGDLSAADKDLKTTDRHFLLYALSDDIIYSMKVEATEDSRVTRITFSGEKHTYTYDIEGLNYYDRMHKTVTAEGFRNANQVVDEIPFLQLLEMLPVS